MTIEILKGFEAPRTSAVPDFKGEKKSMATRTRKESGMLTFKHDEGNKRVWDADIHARREQKSLEC